MGLKSNEGVYKAIIERLTKYLKYKKITQKEVAEALGVTPAAVTLWFNGTNEISISDLTKIITEFDLDIGFVIGKRFYDVSEDENTVEDKSYLKQNGTVVSRYTKLKFSISDVKNHMQDVAILDNMLNQEELDLYLSLIDFIESRINKKEQDQ